MYFRIELDSENRLDPSPRYLDASSYIDAYVKAKKLYNRRILAIMAVKDFFYNVVNR